MSEMKVAVNRLRCHFCTKYQTEVWKLIQGPYAFICDECVRLCAEILDAEITGQKTK